MSEEKIIRGYKLEADWKVSNIGYTAEATKGGKKYFLKRYGEYKMPKRGSAMTDTLYNRMKAEFESFKDNRIAINKALESLAGPGGNIILPCDWFVDDIYYVEASEFVEDLISDSQILRLSKEKKLFVMRTAAGALYNIHRKNIVHSDLKRTNILAAVNSAGNTVAKIIDFDRSYFADKIRPDELGGDQNFMSPELAQCFMYDMADEALAYLSTKSDIYSLGIIFHNYLVTEEYIDEKGKKKLRGCHPRIEGLTGSLKARVEAGETVYCGVAHLSGAQLVVSDKIKDKHLRHLIAAMLQIEPEDRPTAREVLDVLNTKKILEIKPEGMVRIEGESLSPAAATPAGGTSAAAGAAGASSGASTSAAAGGTGTSAAAEKAPPTGFCAPWSEHKISLNEEKLRAGGYVAAEQYERKGVKCYRLFKRDGAERVFTPENLLILGMASRAEGGAPARSASPAPAPAPAPTPAPAPSASADMTVFDEDGTLWEGDAEYRYDMDCITRSGYKGIARAQRKEVKGYALIKADGSSRFMTSANLKILRFIVKK